MNLLDELAALCHPLPEPGSVIPEDCYIETLGQVQQQRKDDALRLKVSGECLKRDALLLELDELRSRKEAVDARIRQVLAFARDFHGKHLYDVEELARAAGYSVSEVRTAYGDEELEFVAQQIGRGPNQPPQNLIG
ncbi:hypothetical protein [Streptomyces sp. NPDC055709]